MLSNATKTQYTSRYNTSSAVELNLEIGIWDLIWYEQNRRKKKINTDFRGLSFHAVTLCPSSLYTYRQKRCYPGQMINSKQ